jgi:hypothetical protein
MWNDTTSVKIFATGVTPEEPDSHSPRKSGSSSCLLLLVASGQLGQAKGAGMGRLLPVSILPAEGLLLAEAV